MFNMKSRIIRHIVMVFLASFILSACGEAYTDTEHLARAKEFRDRGEVQASIIELKNALSINPENLEARWTLGQIYLETGSGADAEKELRRAMSLGLDAQAATVPLARAILQQGRFEEVVELISGADSTDNAEGAVLARGRGPGRVAPGLEDGEDHTGRLSLGE